MKGTTLADVSKLEEFSKRYKRWITDFVDPESAYSSLLTSLYEYEFVPFIDRDKNREEDGRYLRERFATENGEKCEDYYIDWPSSVLEMILALSIKIEDLMYDPDVGDRTVKWFWMMVRNLGFSECHDEAWTASPEQMSSYVNMVIDVFLNRTYSDDSTYGCLFPMKENDGEHRKDLEIWHQMNEYMSTFQDQPVLI